MKTSSNLIAVYGANGHTGQFVVNEARSRGLEVLAVGRNADRLENLFPSDVNKRVADVCDPAALANSFNGAEVVINCAGPFLDTASPVAKAALSAGSHYIDISAEQASVQEILRDFDAMAREADRFVIPGAGFYGGLADLLVGFAASPGYIDEVTIAVGLDRWWPTAGTRSTGKRNTAPRLVVSEGRLAELKPDVEEIEWHFSGPLSKQAMVSLPFSEIIVLSSHLEVGRVRSLINKSALDDIRDPSTSPPVPVDRTGRSAQQFEMAVQITQHGTISKGSAKGQDIYAVTAPIVLEAATRLIEGRGRERGAMALSKALDPVAMLWSLGGSVFELDFSNHVAAPDDDSR